MHTRPRLRPVEQIVVRDPRLGRAIVLRDPQGVAEEPAVLPVAAGPVLARFDGAHTCADIARAASAELGEEVTPEAVAELARALDERCMLDGATFARALDRARAAFARAPVRAASHAGGAYPGGRAELTAWLDALFAEAAPTTREGDAPIVGLVAPHIDPWRGGPSYARAYAALRAGLPERAETFVVLGTSHAPMREPYALCPKAYDTPLGALEIDRDAVDELAAACAFDPLADVLNHKREHSIEFQIVLLKHALGGRPARVVPILAGLGDHQARATDPERDPRVARFLGALRALALRAPGRVVLVAGADLAHVGPRFGDAAPDATARAALERADRASLAHAVAMDPRAFWSDVVRDLDTRRVCGLAPIFTMLEALPEGARGELLRYEQCVDEDGSVVSHASIAFRAPATGAAARTGCVSDE